MEVIIQLDRQLAAAMRSDADATLESRSLRKEFTKLGFELVPLFPGIEDLDMASQFRTDAPNDMPAAALNRIRAWPGVLAAYVKAPGEPPSEA